MKLLLFVLCLANCRPRTAAQEHYCDAQFNQCLADKNPKIRKSYELAMYCLMQRDSCEESK